MRTSVRQRPAIYAKFSGRKKAAKKMSHRILRARGKAAQRAASS